MKLYDQRDNCYIIWTDKRTNIPPHEAGWAPWTMAYNEAEIDLLKGFAKEIIDEQYLTQLTELKKKLTVALSKEVELEQRLKKIESENAIYKQCHSCHVINVDRSDAQTQTVDQEQTPSQTEQVPEDRDIPMEENIVPTQTPKQEDKKPRQQQQPEIEIIELD